MKKPKIKNFLFKKGGKGFKSFLSHMEKYNYQQKLRAAQKIIDNDGNIQDNLDITPKYKDYAKVIKVKEDGTIVYKYGRRYTKKRK